MNQDSLKKFRRGISKIEILVLLLLALIMIALFFPAVEESRESARLRSCKNSLKQIGLALHNYHDAHQVLPFAQINSIRTSNDFPSNSSWAIYLYPYLDQKPLYDQFETEFETKCSINFTGSDESISWLICPSHPYGGKVDAAGFQGNYAACGGSKEFEVTGETLPLDGMFYVQSSVKFTDVSDGLSQTLMLGEIAQKPPSNDLDSRNLIGAYFYSWEMQTCFSTLRKPNTTYPDQTFDKTCSSYDWIQSEPTMEVSAVTFSRSYHLNSSQFALGDGAVRSIANNIDLEIYQALGTRNGSETVEKF